MLAGVPAGTTQPFAFLQRTACQSLLQWPWADVPTAALHDFLERCVGLSQPLGASALCNVTLSVVYLLTIGVARCQHSRVARIIQCCDHARAQICERRDPFSLPYV
jgi:hypothetical protein